MPAIPESAITFTTLLVGLLTTGVLVLLPSTWQGDGRALRYWVGGNLLLSLDRAHSLLPLLQGLEPWRHSLLSLSAACVVSGAAMHVLAMRMLLQPERPRLDGRWAVGAGLLLAAAGALVADPAAIRLLLMVGTTVCELLMLGICRPHMRRLRGASVMAAAMAFFLLMTGSGIWAMSQQLSHGAASAAAPQTPVAILALDLVLSVVVNLAFLMILIELLHQHVERLSITDPLTGVLNRRGLLQSANLQWLAQRQGAQHRQSASVLLLDLDHFKRVNDQLGHAMGDAVLRGTAERVGAVLRQTDVLARWGGEEFVVLLPRTALRQAGEVAERIRVAVAASALADGAPVVTVSIGVASLDDALAIDRLPGLIAEADRRLYLAKQLRNCVVLDDEPPTAKVTAATPATPASAPAPPTPCPVEA